MKAIIKNIDTHVDVSFSPEMSAECNCPIWQDCAGRYYHERELDFIEPEVNINWQDVKIKAAIAMAQGILANNSFTWTGEGHKMTLAIKQADMLVEKLKNEINHG